MKISRNGVVLYLPEDDAGAEIQSICCDGTVESSRRICEGGEDEVQYLWLKHLVSKRLGMPRVSVREGVSVTSFTARQQRVTRESDLEKIREADLSLCVYGSI